MNRFWPRRPLAEGFSIVSLAKNNRRKANDSYEESEQSTTFGEVPNDQSRFKTNLVSKNNLNKRSFIHWANRDFFEYHDAA